VRQRRDAALFPNYFGQTCYSYYIWWLLLLWIQLLLLNVKRIIVNKWCSYWHSLCSFQLQSSVKNHRFRNLQKLTTATYFYLYSVTEFVLVVDLCFWHWYLYNKYLLQVWRTVTYDTVNRGLNAVHCFITVPCCGDVHLQGLLDLPVSIVTWRFWPSRLH